MITHQFRLSKIILTTSLLLFTSISAQLVPNQQIDPACEHVGRCTIKNQIFPRLLEIDQALFSQKPDLLQQALVELLEIAEQHFKEPGDALDCRAGGALVFYRLAEIYRHSVNAPQRAHNLYQLAMSMFWDMSREPNALQCLEAGQVWGLDFNSFMDAYLSLAAQVKRHTVEGLPAPAKFDRKNYRKRKIAITSVCAYNQDHMLHELYSVVKQNRDRYAALHG